MNEQLTNKSLSELIEWWLKQKDARNISTLARGSGVHRDSLTRYLSCAQGQYHYKKVKQIICYMFRCDMKTGFEWLEKNYFKDVEADTNFYQFHKLHDGNTFADETFQEALKNSNTFRLIHLAGTIGITKKQIELVCGQHIIKFLDELIQNGIITNQAGKFKTVLSNWSVNRYQTIIGELKNVTAIMEQREDANIFQNSFATSLEGLATLKQIQKSSFTQAKEAIDKFKGEIPIYFGTFLTQLD